MKLYTFFRSSAAYRVRIALQLKGLNYDSIPRHLRKNGGEHRSHAYLRVNPQGLIPALEVDGSVLAQSLAIIEYLDARWPTPRLLPDDTLTCARVRSLALLIACDIHPLNNLRVLNYLREILGQNQDSVNEWYRHWIAEGFKSLEEQLHLLSSQGRYCVGDTVSLADVCLVPQVYNARRFGCDLTSYPTIQKITAFLETLNAFAAATPEVQPDAEE